MYQFTRDYFRTPLEVELGALQGTWFFFMPPLRGALAYAILKD